MLEQIRLLEIELFSFCNRTCTFCPNSYIDRISENKILPVKVFESVIQELKGFQYSGHISLSRYCEPLAHRAILDSRISYIREHLPKVTIVANTNGDYDYEGVDIDELTIMDYDIKLDKSELGTLTRSTRPFKVRKMRLGKINNRAGALNLRKEYVRDYPCFEPKYFVGIDYNGMVVPCCNIRSDIKSHKEVVLGDLSKSSLRSIFESKIANTFRSNVSQAIFSEICLSCSKGPGRYTTTDPNIKNKTS